MQADAEGIAQIHKRLRCVLADIRDADLAVLLGLSDELIVRFLQKIFKILQMLQVSHCLTPPFLVNTITDPFGYCLLTVYQFKHFNSIYLCTFYIMSID